MRPGRKLKVIVTRRLPREIEARMMELFDTRLNEDDRPLDREALAQAVAEADVFVPTVTDTIDGDLIGHAGPDLKLIASFGTGVDHIDLAAARERGILVTNTPGVLTEDTADMTMALILAVPRRLSEGERLLRGGDWQGWAPTTMLGHRIWGKRLGIIGMGRIGQAVARRARGFGLSIHYHKPEPSRRRDRGRARGRRGGRAWTRCWRIWILSRFTARARRPTYHLLSARRLSLLRPQAYVIINTSRGHAIDEAALVRLLDAGRIGGAGLDVYENEPVVSPKLLTLDNVVALPHIGSATIEGRRDMGEKVLINIQTFADGHNPPDRVIDPAG